MWLAIIWLRYVTVCQEYKVFPWRISMSCEIAKLPLDGPHGYGPVLNDSVEGIQPLKCNFWSPMQCCQKVSGKSYKSYKQPGLLPIWVFKGCITPTFKHVGSTELVFLFPLGFAKGFNSSITCCEKASQWQLAKLLLEEAKYRQLRLQLIGKRGSRGWISTRPSKT